MLAAMDDECIGHVANALGQPIGLPLQAWTAPAAPTRTTLVGRWCRLEPLDAEAHAPALFSANAEDRDGRMWTYLPYGPFASQRDYREWIARSSRSADPLFFAIVDGDTALPVGAAAYLRIDPANGVIECGHLAFSPRLQRRRAATEAMYLMMRHALDRGYRRYEWKCDALNAPSREAARRLGFRLEGVFRQAAIVKGRNRDTAWYSIIDHEWPSLRSAFDRWLEPSNFDENGRQRTRLSELTQQP